MMYVEFIGFPNVPIEESLCPDILLDPGIEILEIRQMSKLMHNVYAQQGYACLLHIFLSDEDVMFLQLKYPNEDSNIFTKVDK